MDCSHAVIFGAGNIGRGFIGQLFSESGYHVVFVDIDEALIDALNRRGSYVLRTVYNDDVREGVVGPVSAIHATALDRIAAAVASCSIAATAVGAAALAHIAPAIAAGLERRLAEQSPGQVNILVCENLKGAATVLRELVTEHTDAETRTRLGARVGFVDTVIGRMVPIPTPEMRAHDVSLVCAEPYKELPVDRAAIVGELPEIEAMMPEDDFPVYTARKLYIHNCGHALLAYAGYLRGCVYGSGALADPEILRLLRGGLGESVAGIVNHYGADPAWLQAHVEDLLHRFANKALGDTIFRLGRDPIRKLSPDDRLVGAATLAVDTGCFPSFLAWGIAAAFLFDPVEDPVANELRQRLTTEPFGVVMEEVAGIQEGSALGKAVVQRFGLLTQCPGRPFTTGS